MISHEEIADFARQAARESGFDLAGIAPVREEDLPELQAFEEWIAAGHAGEMKYMERRTESGNLQRASARNAAPWARSVIVCALNYNTEQPYSTAVHDPQRGWISRYAWGTRDYHDALMPRLRQVETAVRTLAGKYDIQVETRCYVDTGPLVERVYARHAGIGWMGKNTCLINQKLGSWVFLGMIVTSLELAPDLPASDRCGSCTRCIDACPTEAIVGPGKLDARRCIAYLTIEKRGEIAEEFRSAIGHHVFGCDICQDVCPWNNKKGNANPTSLPEFQPRENLFHPILQWLAGMDEEAYRQNFSGSPVKRTKLPGLRRNVALAMGNSGDRGFIPILEKLAADSEPTVAEHAQWSLKRLRDS
ncbi:MAG: tRNA epoxyqueuosine(34) reductase QueG [Candidatus Angelobacter sp.]